MILSLILITHTLIIISIKFFDTNNNACNLILEKQIFPTPFFELEINLNRILTAFICAYTKDKGINKDTQVYLTHTHIYIYIYIYHNKEFCS